MRKPQSLPRFALRYAMWLLGLTVVWLVIYCGFINDQSGLRSTISQLDLTTGRTRTVEYYFWTRHEGAPKETWISKALAGGGRPSPHPDWRTISSKGGYPSLITTFTCYVYGGVWCDVQTTAQWFTLHGAVAGAEFEVADEIAKRWTSIPDIRERLTPYLSEVNQWISALPDGVSLDAALVAKFHEQAGVRMK